MLNTLIHIVVCYSVYDIIAFCELLRHALHEVFLAVFKYGMEFIKWISWLCLKWSLMVQSQRCKWNYYNQTYALPMFLTCRLLDYIFDCIKGSDNMITKNFHPSAQKMNWTHCWQLTMVLVLNPFHTRLQPLALWACSNFNRYTKRLHSTAIWCLPYTLWA